MGRRSKKLEQINDMEGIAERRSSTADRRGVGRRRRAADQGKKEKDVLTALEAARYLRVSRNTLYDAAGRGEVPYRRVGKRMLFSRDALLSWLMCNVA